MVKHGPAISIAKDHNRSSTVPICVNLKKITTLKITDSKNKKYKVKLGIAVVFICVTSPASVI